MKDKDKVIIDNQEYEYSEFYKRLEINTDNPNNKPEIACPKCHNTLFTINYGHYECIANCKCGHKMTVYDG